MILSSEDKRRESCHDVLRMWIWRDVYVDNISYRYWIADLFLCSVSENQGQTPTENESHLDIIKKRYAKGEINKEDFDRMKRDLET